MIKVGELVKIEDVGVLALCMDIKGEEVQLELSGEQFWLPTRCCSSPVIEDEEEVA